MSLIRICIVFVVLLVGGSFVFAAEKPPRIPVEERAAQMRQDLTSPDIAVRIAAVRTLAHNDAAKLLQSELQAALKDVDGEVREWAATVLGSQGIDSRSAVPQLIVQLQGDPVDKARETAARALGRIMKAAPDERQAVPVLESAAKEDADSVVRVVALGALALAEPDAPGRIDAVAAYLTHEDPLTRMKAAHGLGYLGDKSLAAAPAIAVVLQKATDPYQRGYIARSLGQIGARDQLAVLEAEFAKEADPRAQGEMRGAIKRLGGMPVPAKK